MAFGREHRNVSPIIGGMHMGPLTPGDPAFAAQNSDALIRLIRELTPSSGVARGYLYFPPGRYFLGRPTSVPVSIPGSELGDIIIPPDITLWFAPGAVLVPMAGAAVSADMRRRDGHEHLRNSVCIEIHGDILAERRQIFSLWLDEGTMTERAGEVFLFGDRIREVYPEWWGASPEFDLAAPTAQRNAAALQAAIDAAYHNRVSPQREGDGSARRAPGTNELLWNLRPSIPIVMMGQYAIDRELHVGVSSGWSPSATDPWKQPPLAGFELEGERAMGNAGAGHPSLMATTGFSGRALLAIRGPTSFSIRNMTFDGQYRVRSCVTVEPIDPAWGCAIFDGCSFFRTCMQPSAPGASTALVVLDAETRRRATRPGASPVGAPRDFWNVSFRRCLFAPGDIVPDGELAQLVRRGDIPDVANNVVGVEVRLGDNEGLEFRECVIRDAASPGIRAFSGRFALRNCLMHLSRPARLRPDDPGVPADAYSDREVDGRHYPVRADWSLPDHPHGADIIIEEPHALDPSSGVTPLMPASFTLNTVQSHSWQLFAAKKIPPHTRDACVPSPVVVMDTKSILEGAGGARELDPPSVFWPEGGPGSIGSPLTLIGCQFRGRFQDIPVTGGGTRISTLTAEEQTRYDRVVEVGNGMRGPVFNLGTQLFFTNGPTGQEGLTQAVRGTSDAIHPPVLQLRPRTVG